MSESSRWSKWAELPNPTVGALLWYRYLIQLFLTFVASGRPGVLPITTMLKPTVTALDYQDLNLATLWTLFRTLLCNFYDC